ncbi:hypothetical protein [Rubneribacter sp.]
MKKIIVALISILVFVGISASIMRIQQVNSTFKNVAMAPESNSSMQQSSPKTDYALNDEIDISNLTMNKRTASDNVSIRFTSSSIMTMDEIYHLYPNWNPLLGSEWRKYDKPKYLIVEMIVSNDGEEETPLLWFKLTSDSWSTVIEPNDTKMFNGDEHIEDYRVQPGESKSVYAVYALREDTFSEAQWENVNNLPFDAVLLDYPNEISVRVWEGSQ